MSLNYTCINCTRILKSAIGLWRVLFLFLESERGLSSEFLMFFGPSQKKFMESFFILKQENKKCWGKRWWIMPFLQIAVSQEKEGRDKIASSISWLNATVLFPLHTNIWFNIVNGFLLLLWCSSFQEVSEILSWMHSLVWIICCCTSYL